MIIYYCAITKIVCVDANLHANFTYPNAKANTNADASANANTITKTNANANANADRCFQYVFNCI